MTYQAWKSRIVHMFHFFNSLLNVTSIFTLYLCKLWHCIYELTLHLSRDIASKGLPGCVAIVRMAVVTSSKNSSSARSCTFWPWIFMTCRYGMGVPFRQYWVRYWKHVGGSLCRLNKMARLNVIMNFSSVAQMNVVEDMAHHLLWGWMAECSTPESNQAGLVITYLCCRLQQTFDYRHAAFQQFAHIGLSERCWCSFAIFYVELHLHHLLWSDCHSRERILAGPANLNS